jgi:hypothetical protein
MTAILRAPKDRQQRCRIVIPNVYGLFATLWGGRSGSERMMMKFEELVLVAALVVGLITTGWAVLAMAALQ